jgi:hypothetical protein
MHFYVSKSLFLQKAGVTGDIKKVALDPRVPDKVVCLYTKMAAEEQAELLAFLAKNNDVFAWSTSDLFGVSNGIIEHKQKQQCFCMVNLAAKPRKQKLCKMSEEKVAVVKAEV